MKTDWLVELNWQEALRLKFMQENIRSWRDLAEVINENSYFADEIYNTAFMTECYAPSFIEMVEKEFSEMEPRESDYDNDEY